MTLHPSVEVAPAVEVVDGPTLTELAHRANTEHAAVLAAVRSAVMHAINSGDALLQARPMVEGGRWQDWLRDNFSGATATAQQYMRLAYYRDHILSAPEQMPLKRAYTYLRGLPAIDGTTRRGRKPLPPKEQISEARRLRDAGMTYTGIGEVFGVSDSTVRVWLNPQLRKQANLTKRQEYSRRKAGRLALLQKERDAAARKRGGDVADAYSLLRKTTQAIERAAQKAESREDRAALMEALQAAHRAEDHIVRALGVQHGDSGRARTFHTASAVAA